MRKPLGETYAAQHVGGRGAGIRAAHQFKRQHHVFQCVQITEQLKTLENEAHIARAQFSALVFVDGEDVGAIQSHGACGRSVESRQDRQQGALAGTRSADDGHRFARLQLEFDLMENGQRSRGVNHLLADPLDIDEGF